MTSRTRGGEVKHFVTMCDEGEGVLRMWRHIIVLLNLLTCVKCLITNNNDDDDDDDNDYDDDKDNDSDNDNDNNIHLSGVA